MASAHAETAWPQSAAAPSPFPPLAQYAFLSDCHTGALVAPDGTRRAARLPDALVGRHLGNFPQAFSHFAPRETAARVILAERLEEPA